VTGQDRNEGQRQHEGADHGQRNRDGHRAKQLALDPLEREDWHIDGHDNQHGERQRTRDLRRRVLNLAHDAVPGGLALGEVAHDVLGHDHGAVDDDSKVNSPERQQIRGDIGEVHEDEGEQQ
jgi:hypothetical protein